MAVYGKVIDDLYAAGCRNLQLDDCTWGMFADKIGNKLTEEEQWAKLRLVKEVAEEVWGK